jgi:4-diphosphocytidyl-2-C-methyl-D-erythritol kinase
MKYGIMIVFPKAKINLGLRITGKRHDGYHNIETVFYPIGLCDALELVVAPDPIRKDTLTVTGISTGVDLKENIILKAVLKIREKYSFPRLKIHLHKAIPHGAGLGGGSSDAVCMLKTINRYFGLSIDEQNLKSMALDIGSDCPFFIDGNPAFASGRGEILNSINPVLTGYYLLLLNPGIGISTREAYENCTPEIPSTNLFNLVGHNIREWRDLIINDFEYFAFRKYPLIKSLKEDLYRSGALFSSMSGSGSSVYGIFSEKPKTDNKFKDLVIYEGVM